MDISKLKSVMVVDGNYVNGLIVRKNLEIMGYEAVLEVKPTVEEALDYLHFCFANDMPFPQLILLEVKIGKESGFDFIDAFENYFFSVGEGTLIFLWSSINDAGLVDITLDYPSVKGFCYKSDLPRLLTSVDEEYYSIR